MKKYLFLATAALGMFASCTSDDFVGNNDIPADNNATAIVFNTGLKTVTRGDHTGADAAGLLHNHFTVSGFKGEDATYTAVELQTGTVFDNYVVSWAANTAGTTQSNTSDWEYVGTPVVAPSGLYDASATEQANQSIKYWDYSAKQYDFIAYSTGSSTAVTTTPTAGQVQVTAIDATKFRSAAYKLTGAAADLQNCYIADMVTVYKDGTGKGGKKYQDEVQLTFRNLASKVRVALYETVPGYSVKDVKFYTDATTTLATGASEDKATLFTTGTGDKDNFYTAGTYTVSFPTTGRSKISDSDYNKAHVSFTATGSGTTKEFGAVNYVAAEHKEKTTGNIWLGRTSATASFAGSASPYYAIAMPNEEGTVLELRIDYTLEATDGSGEEIKIHGATAFVPAIYAQWKPNYAYTYIFKISDNTNGWTSTVDTDPAGLYPITFSAVVVDSEENTQSTITTVATPSITTYQKGHVYTDNEYVTKASDGDIYIQVMTNGTLNADLDTKGTLYTITPISGKTVTEADVMDALNIRDSETTTAPIAITGFNGWVLTDATTSASVDATITTIPGADGNNITVTTKTAAKFTPTANTTYAYVYLVSTGTAKTYYLPETLSTQPSGWPTDWYTDANGNTSATTFTPGTTYYKKRYTNLNNVYGVKVIRVQ